MLTRVLGVSAGPVGGRGHTLWTATDVAERSFESTPFTCFQLPLLRLLFILVDLLTFNKILPDKRISIGIRTFPGSLWMVNDVTVASDCSDSPLCQS